MKESSQNNNGGRLLLQQHVEILLALYDAEKDKAGPALSADKLAAKVNSENNKQYRPDCLWKYVRSLSQVFNGQSGFQPDWCHLHIIGCESTGQSLVQLTGIGLEAARHEYAKRQLSKPITPAEIVRTTGIGGLSVFA